MINTDANPRILKSTHHDLVNHSDSAVCALAINAVRSLPFVKGPIKALTDRLEALADPRSARCRHLAGLIERLTLRPDAIRQILLPGSTFIKKANLDLAQAAQVAFLSLWWLPNWQSGKDAGPLANYALLPALGLRNPNSVYWWSIVEELSPRSYWIPKHRIGKKESRKEMGERNARMGCVAILRSKTERVETFKEAAEHGVLSAAAMSPGSSMVARRAAWQKLAGIIEFVTGQKIATSPRFHGRQRLMDERF